MTEQQQQQIVEAVARAFPSFGGGRIAGAEWNPIISAMKDEPAQFAMGVDIAEVVQFVAARLEALHGVQVRDDDICGTTRFRNQP